MASLKEPRARKPTAHAHVVNTRRSSASTTPRVSGTIKVKRNAQAGKPKTTKVAGKRGPKDHFQGAEADYLLTRLPEYEAAVKTKKPGAVAHAIGRDLVQKFGDQAFHIKAVAGDAEDADSDDDGGDKDDEPEITVVAPGEKTAPQILTQAAADLHAGRLDILATVSGIR